MGSSRRVFTKDIKTAAVQRLATGASVDEVAQFFKVHPKMLHRWRREANLFEASAFAGYGNNRSEVPARSQAIAFRLNRDELELFKKAFSTAGARSISDFVRTKVLQATRHPSLSEIEAKLDDVASAVQQLASAVSRLERSQRS
jgi:transposase-like protein